jgi:hypothetical protein
LIGIVLATRSVTAQSSEPRAHPVAASLGAPQGISTRVRGAEPDDDPLIKSSSRPSNNGPPKASLGKITVGKPVSGITLGPPEETRLDEEAYNWGTVTKPWKSTSRPKDPGYDAYSGLFRRSGAPNEDDWVDGDGPVGGGGSRFSSDTDFQNFVSPTSNPFLAEDPRKLTELRTILFYQTIPNSQYLYRGGNLQTIALQGRLGITDNLSVVVHKLGLLVVNPGGMSLLENESGITEIWLGPKYTFYRDCESGAIAAGGVIFQIPVGPSSIYQDTGNFGLVPYLTGAKKFGRSSFGQFTVLDTLGYHFGTGSERSDFFYNTLHLDFDIANLGRFFPFIELNYFNYTTNGTARPGLFFEGRDIGNVGSSVSGRTYLTTAIGSRFKFTQGFEFGIVGEFPLNGARDLLDFRFGVDFIFRF